MVAGLVGHALSQTTTEWPPFSNFLGWSEMPNGESKIVVTLLTVVH